MKIRQWMKCGILMIAFAVMMCGFGGTVLADETVQEAADTYSLADLYERTETENIFKLDMIDTEGYGIEEACLRDGYMLILLRDYSEEGYESEIGIQHLLNSGKMVLMPIERPEAMVIRDVERFEGKYTLLENGAVMNTGWYGGYTLYDSDLEEIVTENDSCGKLLGVSEQGDIWYLTDDSSFVLYRDGEQVLSVGTEGMGFGDYLGTRSGKAYFNMYNNYYGWTYAVIDMQDGTCSEENLPYNYYETDNGYIIYDSADRWYVADIETPFAVTAFSKPYSDDGIWKIDDEYLIGLNYQYDETAESYRTYHHIYDMRSGDLCGQKEGSEISKYGNAMLDYDKGLILYVAQDEDMAAKGLYLWDISDLAVEEPARVYETIDYQVDQNRIEELIQEIYDRYGVIVYYDREHLKEYSRGYDLIECTDTELLGNTLLKLKECMAEYPDGFFEEIKADSISKVVFCLCDAHDRVDMDTIEDAAATVNTIEDVLRMSIDVHYWQDLRRIFLHENTHMMEDRLAEEMPKISSRNHVEYWYLELNSPECPPIQQYIWEQTDENLKGVYDGDPENAWYIDWYSKCTINEDHARVMENSIYSASDYYFTSPHIDRKRRFLIGMIREAFPCVKNSPEVFWEQRSGIVDLYEEFPDFFDQK